MDIEEFYKADERRRRSEEIEFGTEWLDVKGARYEVSWVADTGELYVMGEPNTQMSVDLFGDLYEPQVTTGSVTVAVVGWIPDRTHVEQTLDGWQEAMTGANGLAWLTERLRQQSVPRERPA
ncbi:MAG TPA: hypothetical protein VID75_10925 [Acidimicrobiales bacterium]|jgi:hypothetical protein